MQATVMELGEHSRQAELEGDVTFLDGVLAADCIGMGPRGFMLTKADWLDEQAERPRGSTRAPRTDGEIPHGYRADHRY